MANLFSSCHNAKQHETTGSSASMQLFQAFRTKCPWSLKKLQSIFLAKPFTMIFAHVALLHTSSFKITSMRFNEHLINRVLQAPCRISSFDPISSVTSASSQFLPRLSTEGSPDSHVDGFLGEQGAQLARKLENGSQEKRCRFEQKTAVLT